MPAELLSHHEMCGREGLSLQRGMNFKVRGGHSVLLMSQRPGAPYRDALSEDGTVLFYEGHDAPVNTTRGLDPKTVDQPLLTPGGRLTQNGLFYEAAVRAQAGEVPERVRVYEKLRAGLWADNGVFELFGAALNHDGVRQVVVFSLRALADGAPAAAPATPAPRRRVIPTAVKLEVWKRDGGRCVVCGETDELQFDHVLPYALGGTSLTAENVQLLCARHNLAKGARLD